MCRAGQVVFDAWSARGIGLSFLFISRMGVVKGSGHCRVDVLGGL